MTAKILEEIKQTKASASLEAEVYISLLRTADRLSAAFAPVFKPVDLSPVQYNVLRILRGAGRDGLACGEIGERLVTRDPDITRLLDRLEKRGLIARSRESKDRRVITVRITQRGVAAIAPLDAPIAATHRRQLGHLGEARLRELLELLDAARERAGG